MVKSLPPRVLIIAGSDPSGGAGIQADIKTVTALGGYAATAITALTVQNTVSVSDVCPVPPEFIKAQITAIIDDIGADAVKIGMVGDRASGHAIADALQPLAGKVPIVLDPVLVATSGDTLAQQGVDQLILDTLSPMCSVITPNSDEAAALTKLTVESIEDQEHAASKLVEAGAAAALVKGGHLQGAIVTDVLKWAQGINHFQNARLVTNAGHGTGCTLASAIATGLASKQKLDDAVGQAIAFVRSALEAAPGYGAGTGPLNHAFDEGNITAMRPKS